MTFTLEFPPDFDKQGTEDRGRAAKLTFEATLPSEQQALFDLNELLRKQITLADLLKRAWSVDATSKK